MSLVPAILRTWRSRAFLFAMGVLLALILAAQVPRLIHHHEEKKVTAELDAFIAELNAKEPGWQLADIEARRAPVPDEENSAKIVLAASKLLPEKWPPESFAEMEERRRIEEDSWLREEDIKLISEEIDKYSEARNQAHRLEEMPLGRFQVLIDNEKGYLHPEHIGDVERLAKLLFYESLVYAHSRKHCTF